MSSQHDTITVFGAGYVGLVSGVCLASAGHPVTVLDIDESKLDALVALGITIVERKDILDFAELVRSLAEFQDDEEVYELHPVVQLVQMLVERSDMVNYAPYWYSQRLDWPGHVPSSVVMTSGTDEPVVEGGDPSYILWVV